MTNRHDRRAGSVCDQLHRLGELREVFIKLIAAMHQGGRFQHYQDRALATLGD
ncbi:hypothetical protein D3C76_1480950 [compost metagenome]